MCFAAIGAAVIGSSATVAAQTAAGIAAVGTAVSTASAGLQYAGQRQQAKQQIRYQAQAAAAERQRFLQEQTAIRIRQAQEQKAAGEELADIARRTEKGLDTVTMLAANRGITGISLEALRGDIARQAGDVQFRIAEQQEMGETATVMGLEQAEFATLQRQIGIRKPVAEPSLALAGMQALSGSLQAYATGRQIGATYEE